MTLAELPRPVVIAVCMISFFPAFATLLGLDLSMNDVRPPETVEYRRIADETTDAYFDLAGAFAFGILEWTAACIAMVTAALSIVHYRLKEDVTTPIIGTAMFCGGTLDAFIALAGTHLAFMIYSPESFLPFMWAISRSFQLLVIIAGTAPFLLQWEVTNQQRKSEVRYIASVGVLFTLMAYATVYIFAEVTGTPQSVFPSSIIPRPYDTFPLLLLIVAGGFIFPRFHQLYPSLFSQSLVISVIPAIMSEVHVTFFSTALYDHHFIVGYLLKIIGYLVPLLGLILDYTRAYQAEITLQSTVTKLQAAREIQQSLLPHEPPELHGYEFAGFSYPAEAVGGDYFDYVPMKSGGIGAVVGDVSGHDLGASILMSQTRAYLRALANSEESTGEILSKLNSFLSHDTKDRRFVTLFFMRINSHERCLEYAGAGHEAHIIRKSGEVITLSAEHPPLGILDATIPVLHTPAVHTDDFILIMTDGIVEAKNPDGELFGNERAFDIIRRNADCTVQHCIDQLYAAVQKYTGGIRPKDDVTVVLIKVLENELAPRPRLSSGRHRRPVLED